MRRALPYLLLVAGLIVALWAHANRPRPAGPTPPPDLPLPPKVTGGAGKPLPRPPRLETPEESAPGRLSISGDAAAKRGDFWLEQTVILEDELSPGPLADLYLTIDPQTGTGVRLHVEHGELRLERAAAGSPQFAAAPQVLAGAPLTPAPAAWIPGGGKAVLGAFWRGGELTAWWNEQVVLTWRGAADLTGPSGGLAYGRAVRLGARRAVPLGAVEFHDDFMRETPGETWLPYAGRWELTAVSFPDRSANPFALRVSFGAEPVTSDRLYADRLKGQDYGLGVQLGSVGNLLQIARITGGSPAARAGLQEDDIIVGLNGQRAEDLMSGQVYHLLTGGPADLRLEVLRCGERQLRAITLTRDAFRWGTLLEGHPIPPATDAEEALIVAGEAGWTDYAAQAAVKLLGSGGAGLAVAVTSPQDYLLLRWVGPAPRAARTEARPERLELVRVAAGRATVLAEKPVRYRPYEFYRLGLDWRGEDIKASVDGIEVLSAKTPGLRRGKVGLYAQRGDPVFFDDVSVTTDRGALTGPGHPERKVNAIFAREQDMEQWANPALEWQRDERSPWAVHTARFPGEQVVALNQPRFADLEVRLLAGDDFEREYRLAFRCAGGVATFNLPDGRPLGEPLKIGTRPVRRLVVRADQTSAEADLDGQRLRVALPNAPGAAATPAARCDRIAIRGLKNLGAPDTVRVSSSRTLEYTFDQAPADWKVESGRWGLLNKWICDPRWSWFGGRSETIAAIWNKNVFGGDICVDAYVALMMKRDEPPYDHAGYERAGDYNLVLCGDGVNLDSGYSLICGGGGNYWTRLYRNGRLVAEATDERFRLPGDRVRNPDKPELHQRWFHLRLERLGNRVAFYRDGQQAFEFSDPDPLPAGRVGFWTCENGVLLARCRIAYAELRPGPLESRHAASYDDGTVVNLYDGEALTHVEREGLPPEIAAALSAPPMGFAPAAAPPLEGPPGEHQGWRVTNGTGGGPLALQWKTLQVDPSSSSVVRMALRIESGTAVDFCLKDLSSGQLYRWRLTGPPGSSGKVPLVGQLPGVPADGRWHAVQYDLGPSWRTYWRDWGAGEPPHGAYRPLFACLENADYAIAGFGVNHAGAAYAVAPLSFLTPEDLGNPPPPAAATPPHAAELPSTPEVRAIFVSPAASAPQFGPLRLADVIPLEPSAALGVTEVEDAPPWALEKRSLRVTARRDGTLFGFKLRRAQYDLAQWPYLVLDYKIPREVPVNLFFHGSSGWGLDDNGLAGGERGLVLSDTGDPKDGFMWRFHGPTHFSAYLPRPADFVDDGTWRHLEIPLLRACAASPAEGSRWIVGDFSLYDHGWRGNRQGMSYTIHALYAMPAARSDRLAFQWRAGGPAAAADYASAVDEDPATVPTGHGIQPMETIEAAALRARGPDAPPPAGPLVGDGWKYLHLRRAFAAGAWSAPVHYKFRVDNTPPRVMKTEPQDGGRLVYRTVRLHLAEDHAVVPESLLLIVNGQPFQTGDPAVSYDSATDMLTFDAAQAAGRVPWITGQTVKVELQEAADSLGNVQREPYRFSFVLDRELDREGPAIRKIRFCAPHGLAGRQPPRPILAEVSLALDFEETLGHLRALQDCRLDWTNDPATAAFGRRAVRFVALEDDGDLEVLLHKDAIHLDQFPLMHFDYKAGPGFRADLQAMVLGQWYTVRFLGDGDSDHPIGAVGGVVSDGQWHHAGVNLRTLLESNGAPLPVRLISEIRLASHGQSGTRRGAALWLDNLHLCPANGGGGQVEWEAADDPSGVAGYSVFFDQQPATEAPPVVNSTRPVYPVRGQEGTWFVHVRAVDGAGNWGPTRHLRLDF